MTYPVRNICVYCGSSIGKDPAYREGAAALGAALAARNIGLVFGGGSVGLMGVIANAVLAAGGRAIGIVPTTLDRREIKHNGLTELHIVSSMHERKAKMAELADAFITMPGGYGTFDELFEAITWAQLGLHRKPIALYNIAGYFNPLLAMIEQGVEQKFIPAANRRLLIVGDIPAALLDQIITYNPKSFVAKWDGSKP